MEPKILVMGEQQDYYEADVSRARLKEGVSKRTGGSEEGLLKSLRIEDTKIPAHQLKNYGGTIPLTEGTVANETIMDGLERFFEKASGYAEKHNAPYVLVQDLKIEGHHTFDIYGLAQLLIE